MTKLTLRRRIFGALGCIGIAIFLGISGAVHVTQACQQIGRSARWALLRGGLAAAATLTVIARSPRTGIWERSGLRARTFRWALGLWFVMLFVGLAVTNPQDGSNDLNSGLMVGIATCAGATFIALFLRIGITLLRPNAGSAPAVANTSTAGWEGGLSHQYRVAHSQHHPEVWHVDVSRDAPDYFIAHCDCDWVGTPLRRNGAEC